MGDKRPSTRTLDSGEKVTHYPDGRQVLQQSNALAALFESEAVDTKAAAKILVDDLVQAAEDKREAQANGNEVPSDKRPL